LIGGDWSAIELGLGEGWLSHILSYENGLPNALKNISSANVNKVILELRIKVDRKIGILFVRRQKAILTK
jgi:hypothetical protein